MKTIKQTIFIALLFLVATVNAQTTHYIQVGGNGFSKDSLLVEVNDIVEFSLNLNTANGIHYSETTSVPSGGNTWNYSFTCSSCIYSVVINVEGTYLHLDFNSGSTGVIYTQTISGIENINGAKEMDNRIFDLLGKEIKDLNTLPIGTFYIQNGVKYIKQK
ncbi:MAG: hypothetical protein H8E84_04070 [Flavobacteriales bacterium]|nr:hypothetical protein [Flavobacteriales bacterium]